MGLLKRLSRSRSSEKVQTSKQHASQPASEPGMLGRLPKFRSKSKSSGLDSRTSVDINTTSSSLNKSSSGEALSFNRVPQDRSPIEPTSSSAMSQLSFMTLQPSRSSFGIHSLEHNPDTSFDQPVVRKPLVQSRRPFLPAAPRPPVKEKQPNSIQSSNLSQTGNAPKQDNSFNGSSDARRFDKPLIIEIPRIVCESCKEACTIEALKINNVYYHPHCFVCTACNIELSYSPYFAKEGGIYCTKDFNALFGTKCRSCKDYIQGDVVAVLGFTYHPACFNCTRCGKSFEAGQEVIIDKEDTYCENCPPTPGINLEVEIEQQSPVAVVLCSGCKQIISDMSKSLCALEGNWHPQCLKCHACQKLLTKEYFVQGQKIYCERDYLKQFGVKCNNCAEYIVGKVIEAGSKRYHPTCAQCSVCEGIFAEGQDMLVHGDEVWHPACNSRHSGNKSSRSTANDSFQESSIYTTDDLNISDDLNSINVVTLDYSVPEELLTELQEGKAEQTSSPIPTSEASSRIAPAPKKSSLKSPPILKNKQNKQELYENIEIPYPKFPNKFASSSTAQTSEPTSKFISLTPDLRSKNCNPFIPNSTSLYDIPFGDAIPEFELEISHASAKKSETESESMSHMPRSTSFDRNKKYSVPFSAPVMNDNMFRSKSNDRLKVFQPKGSDAYVGGYLNPAEPSDLAPGLFQRFPSLRKQQSEDKRRQRQTSFSQPPKSTENLSTRPGNLNKRNNYTRGTSLGNIQREQLQSRRNNSQAEQLKEEMKRSNNPEPPRSKSSFDIGNRSRRVNSDDYTENSAKCFYDKERLSRSRIEFSFSACDEEDSPDSKYDEYLTRSGIGKEYLQSTKGKSAKAKLEESLKVSDDPRGASRDPSALLPPPNPLRYKNPYQASPSRVLGYLEIENESDDTIEHKSELTEVFRSTGKKQKVRPPRNREMSVGNVTTDDSGLDCFSEPEGSRKSVSTSRLLDSQKGYRSDFEPAETSRKQRKSNEKRAKLLHDNFINYMKAVKHGFISAYGTEENLDEIESLSAVSEIVPLNSNGREVKIYSLNQLQTTNKKLPKDVKRKSLEVHLSEQEFFLTFHMTRNSFYQLPLWKRNILKKFNYLF